MSHLEEQIAKKLEESIKPALAMHEGSATLNSVRETDDLLIIKINFQGNCSGCEGARGGTLRSIQEYLKEELEISHLIVVPEEN